MPRSHFTRKHCLAMTGGLTAFALLILCFTHSTIISGKITDPGTDESTLELLHVVSSWIRLCPNNERRTAVLVTLPDRVLI